MIYSEELQQDMQSRNINMKMNKERSVQLKQRVKEFRSRIEVDQTERGKGFHGKICKLLPQKSSLDVAIDVLDGNPFEFNYFISVFKELAENRIAEP